MNLLAKEQIEDSMLRVHGKEIAAELLETALGRRGSGQEGRLLRIQSEQRHKKSGATTPCGYVTPSKTASRFQFF